MLCIRDIKNFFSSSDQQPKDQSHVLKGHHHLVALNTGMPR
jgi:hypothetical protein